MPVPPLPSSGAPAAAASPPQHITGRVAVSSIANLLLVLLLRLNHALAPAIVHLFRARRERWVERATADIKAELHRWPNARNLCAGPCCQPSYGTFSSHDEPDSHVLSVQDWVRAVANAAHLSPRTAEDVAEDVDEAAELVEDVYEGDTKQLDDLKGETEIYFALRVQQEARHRRTKKIRVLDKELVLIWLTLFTLVLYSAAIIVAVQYYYRLDLWELGVFSASLLATASFAEGATLRRAWLRLL